MTSHERQSRTIYGLNQSLCLTMRLLNAPKVVQMVSTNKILAPCNHIIFHYHTNVEHRGYYIYLHDASALNFVFITIGLSHTLSLGKLMWKWGTWEEKQNYRTVPASKAFHALLLFSCLHLCTFTYCTCINIYTLYQRICFIFQDEYGLNNLKK